MKTPAFDFTADLASDVARDLRALIRPIWQRKWSKVTILGALVTAAAFGFWLLNIRTTTR